MTDIDGPPMPKCDRCQEEVNELNIDGLCEDCAEEEEHSDLLRDKERMDWLEKGNHADLLHCDLRSGHYVEQFEMQTQPNVRAAIDEAMKKDSE